MPPTQLDDGLLLDMLLSADEAMQFASALTFAEFKASRLHQLAIIKAVETIGEAASQVSDSTQQSLPEIPWPGIIGMRNRLVHGYAAVRPELVWRVLQEDIPALAEQLRRLVPKEG